MRQVLIIEDEVSFCFILKTWFNKNGFSAEGVFSANEAMKCIKTNFYDIILSDLRLPDNDGISLLQWIKQKSPESEVFIMTSYADIQTAVAAIKLGAFDYLEKPINPEILQQKINDALLTKKKNESPEVEKIVESKENESPYIIGKSPISQKLDEHIRLVAPTFMSVLITGESGTGKEYAARHIHENSQQRQAPFVALDCGAISKELGASELFGHVKGAFTSAVDNKKGMFEYANGGTLFLDEIGNLSYAVQVQLLRALEERIVRPVGSNKEIKINVRIISATNEDLSQAIAEGKFREDLYHRINEFSIHMPSLRERRDDLFLFAGIFLENANKELGKNIKDFNEKTKSLILSYPWPGNLRELKNIIRRAVLLCSSDYIDVKSFPEELMKYIEKGTDVTPLKRTNEEELIMDALKKCGNNKSKAAKLLGVDRKTLYNKMERYNINL